MTDAQREARRLWRHLYQRAGATAPQRCHPPADYVRLDLLIERADLALLNEAVATLQREAPRRLTRAEVGRLLLTRAVRLLAAEADYKPRKRGRPKRCKS